MTAKILVDPAVWAQSLAEQLVEAARRKGAQACDAAVGTGSTLSCSARDGAIEDVTRASTRAAGVRVVVDGRLGFATAADAPQDAAQIEELAAAAVALARLSTPSAFNVVPTSTAPTGAALEARVQALGTWDPTTADATPEWAARHAIAMERALAAVPGVATVKDCEASARRGVFALATSSGFSGSYRGTSASFSASGVVEDEGGRKQVEGHWTASRRLESLEHADAVAAEAARRVLARRGARKIPSTRAPVIFDPSTARGFFGAILGALSGDVVARRASFLAGKKGEIVLTPGIALVDDPTLPGGFASRPFDGEGLDVRRVEIVDATGRPTTYLHDARSAARTGEQPTGHAARGATSLPSPSPSNVTVVGGRGDLASIVKSTQRGLLVTRMLGRGPDMVTGDYSRGASGFWIEGGEIAFPVEEITIAGTMKDMMAGIDAVGDDLDERSSLRAPTIRFAELQISGA